MYQLPHYRLWLISILAALLCFPFSNYIVTRVSNVSAKQNLTGRQRYRVVHGWPQMPKGYIIGQGTGVGIDSKNNVVVFHRAGRTWVEPFPIELIKNPTIAIFDGKTGKLLSSWGQDLFIMPHGLTVDERDNIWVTDVGRHQIFKFSHDGKLLMTLGEREKPGADGSHFDRPTDVAVLKDGSFYVSDGYRNTRVVKFSADGKFQYEWGKKGNGPGEFNLPHGIATDNQGRVYVCDRSNARVQIFDPMGKYISEWKDPQMGRPYGISIGINGDVFVVDGGDQPQEYPDRGGAVRMSQSGKILDSFGSFGNYDGQFRLAHDVAVDKNGAVYVIDTWGMRIQKFMRLN
jgi:peptidylamidoglycolate lyase